MGRDTVEFGSGELRVVGGDYGALHLEGTSDQARRTVEQIVAAVRRGGGRDVVVYLQLELDDSPDLFEDRHAGREGTPERGVGVGDDDARGPVGLGAKVLAEKSARSRPDKNHP